MSSAAFEFTADDSTATFSCQFDAGGLAPCSGPGNTHTVSGLANGSHSFTVRAADANGNSTTATRSFFVSVAAPPAPTDTEAPETTIRKGPKRKTEKTRAKFKFTSNEPGSTFECKLDKDPFDPARRLESTDTSTTGKHKFRVRAIDPAGNVDRQPAKYKWKVT